MKTGLRVQVELCSQTLMKNSSYRNRIGQRIYEFTRAGRGETFEAVSMEFGKSIVRAC